MTEAIPTSALVLASLTALSGLAFGLVYFWALYRTADLLAGGSRWVGPAALTLGRLAGAAVFMMFLARLGAMALLAGFLGFLLARMFALHGARRVG